MLKRWIVAHLMHPYIMHAYSHAGMHNVMQYKELLHAAQSDLHVQKALFISTQTESHNVQCIHSESLRYGAAHNNTIIM